MSAARMHQEQPNATPSSPSGRLIVVANRLPLSLSKDATTGEWKCSKSSGGLVAALSGLDRASFVWVGWPGCVIAPEDQQDVTELLGRDGSVPVYLSEKIAEDHYNGFSNSILWPLFHYMPGDIEFDDNLWSSYIRANQFFADVIEKIYQPGDLIWVHDYHLMVLPRMLRRQVTKAKIGFFLHIPFPSSEIFRILPWKREILLGLLECDLLGFHTYDFSRYFLKSCTRVLGVETVPNGVFYKDRFVAAGVFPIGIEPDKFEKNLTTPKVQNRIRELRATFEGKKVLVGVDRLDYIKGLPHKLLGLELFLEQFPEWRGKVVLIQVAVPSRQDVPEYQRLKSEVDQLVGRINGKFGLLELGYSPVQYLFRSVDFDELCALYSIADCAYVTSVRDGMNLVSLEYIMCQQENYGTLILSEFAGAAQSLCGGSLLVNPWNTEELSAAIHTALTMPMEIRKQKLDLMLTYVKKYTSAFWGSSFVAELSKSNPLSPLGASTPFPALARSPKLNIRAVLSAYETSSRRLIMFTYDGTLVPFSPLPSLCRPPRKLQNQLKELGTRKGNHVFILSGRDKRTLDEWFRGIPIGLSAEHGFYLRRSPLATPPGSPALGNSGGIEGPQWDQLIAEADVSWKDTIRPLFKHYSVRTPGSFVEETEVQLVWHYRNADEVFGLVQARELHAHLDNLPLDVVVGDKRIGVRPLNVNPSAAFRKIVSEVKELDFILCVGDFPIAPSDLPPLPQEKVFTCSVGRRSGREHYYLNDVEEVGELLEQLSTVPTL